MRNEILFHSLNDHTGELCFDQSIVTEYLENKFKYAISLAYHLFRYSSLKAAPPVPPKKRLSRQLSTPISTQQPDSTSGKSLFAFEIIFSNVDYS